MDDVDWTDMGAVGDLAQAPVQPLLLGRTRIALTCKDGVFGTISGVCNHAGGPFAVITYRRTHVRLISVRRSRAEEVALYES